MGPLFSLFQALLFNQPSVHLFLFEPLQVFFFFFLPLGYIICFQYFVGGPVPCVLHIVLCRKVWNKTFGDHELSTRGIITFFNPNFNVVSKKRHGYKMGMILQANRVESRSRMRPGWKICLLILDICIGYFIKRLKICIAGFLGIVAIFYQVKQKHCKPDLTPKHLYNAPPNQVKSKSNNNNNKKSNDISQRNPGPYSLRIPIRGFCLEDTFRVPVAADFPFELDGIIAGAGADGASTGGLLTELLTVTWLIVLLLVLG